VRLYNTLTRQKEQFIPIKPDEVGFYVCGPTVYNHIHIGNARTFISFDVIRRYFEYLGYQVNFIQNITDVDDKIINRAAEEGITPDAVAKKYTEAFIQAMQTLGVKPPSQQPRATEELAAMISIIKHLVDNGHAYVVDGDVYFAVRSYADYGALSGRNIDQLKSGARVEVDERKSDALDFALWKAAKPGEPAWDSPWGPGRPGWHIECSAMSQRYLGESFDIHGGGEDLIFPHHENEIAQSKAAGNGFARYWLHGGMLTINEEKMSKSVGNFLLLKDVLNQVRPQALRLLMLQSHYRSPFDYSPMRLDEAESALIRVENALRNLDWAANAEPAFTTEDLGQANQLHQQLQITDQRFTEQMDDDFNTAGAVAAIYQLISDANTSISSGLAGPAHAQAASDTAAVIRRLLGVLGIDLVEASIELPAGIIALANELTGFAGDNLDKAAADLLALRAFARSTQDWQTADAIREGLSALGLGIEDTANGMRLFLTDRQS
jgi:cysteinyl-tRNA synthetase